MVFQEFFEPFRWHYFVCFFAWNHFPYPGPNGYYALSRGPWRATHKVVLCTSGGGVSITRNWCCLPSPSSTLLEILTNVPLLGLDSGLSPHETSFLAMTSHGVQFGCACPPPSERCSGVSNTSGTRANTHTLSLNSPPTAKLRLLTN